MWRYCLAAVLTVGIAGSAAAQTICGKREAFLTQLGKSHEEAPVAVGLVSNGSVIEVLASKEGSWTMLVTHPSGATCVYASGEAWEAVVSIAFGPDA